jgi:hypothetical protein
LKARRIPIISIDWPGVFKEHSRLTKLDLTDCELDRLQTGDFKSLANLERLNLSHTMINGLEPGAFKFPHKISLSRFIKKIK